jgi:hypothetical protein
MKRLIIAALAIAMVLAVVAPASAMNIVKLRAWMIIRKLPRDRWEVSAVLEGDGFDYWGLRDQLHLLLEPLEPDDGVLMVVEGTLQAECLPPRCTPGRHAAYQALSKFDDFVSFMQFFDDGQRVVLKALFKRVKREAVQPPTDTDSLTLYKGLGCQLRLTTGQIWTGPCTRFSSDDPEEVINELSTMGMKDELGLLEAVGGVALR